MSRPRLYTDNLEYMSILMILHDAFCMLGCSHISRLCLCPNLSSEGLVKKFLTFLDSTSENSNLPVIILCLTARSVASMLDGEIQQWDSRIEIDDRKTTAREGRWRGSCQSHSRHADTRQQAHQSRRQCSHHQTCVAKKKGQKTKVDNQMTRNPSFLFSRAG